MLRGQLNANAFGKLIGVGIGIGIEHDMSFSHEQLDVYRVALEPAEYGTAGIDTDVDTDSDPVGGSRAKGLPNRSLEPTSFSWRAHRETSCAGGSTPQR
jgi:hypothetical protein